VYYQSSPTKVVPLTATSPLLLGFFFSLPLYHIYHLTPHMMVHSPSYLEVILFSFVRYLSKKITKIDFLFFEKKPKPVQTDRFWFGYFGIKTGSNRFGSVFSGLAWFFPI